MPDTTEQRVELPAYRKRRRETGDCEQWLAKRKCSKEESCSFKHDTNKISAKVKPNVIDQVLLHQALGHQEKTVMVDKVQHKEKSRKLPVRLENGISRRLSALRQANPRKPSCDFLASA